jgi:hypothetical protein
MGLQEIEWVILAGFDATANGWIETTWNVGGCASRQMVGRLVDEEGRWICGRSASRSGCASPAFLGLVSKGAEERGEMLAFAHIPTGPAATG